MKKVKVYRAVISLALVIAALVTMGGFGGKSLTYRASTPESSEPLSRSDIEYLNVEAPAASSNDGTVNAQDWAAVYPYITVSMGANSENSYVTDYLEQDPYLVNIYEGYGFARDYGSARGHEYTLEDVAKTQRPHPKANCLTCKTPNFAKLVNDQGVGVYSMPFDEVYAQMEESISCYTCHGNEAGNAGALVVTHSYVNKALGDAVSAINASTLSCGQCHIEYYFKPDDSHATTVPYTSVEEMSPDAILAYYDSIDFADWTQESTGAKLLKAQHPEMETYLGEGSVHAGMGLNCATCHMEKTTTADGYTYTNHAFVSPVESEYIQQNVCATCHKDTDIAEKVHTLQDTITARETEVGNNLSALNDKLTEAVESGSYSEEQLDEIRGLYRSAQWFFDFDYVENSEGAHNSKLANQCLDTAQEYIDQANALF